jgi:dipeptidyl aminopeptidase/acylaminoacyl peptidase
VKVSNDDTVKVLAQRFDLRTLESAGEPVPIAEQVPRGNFSASLRGTLVYGSGAALEASGQLTLFDRQGRILGTAGEPGDYDAMAFSPDGKRVVATRISQSGIGNLWMMDLVRGTSTRLTFDSGFDQIPVWSPDGNRIAFSSTRDGHTDLYQKLSNGGGDDELLFKSDTNSGVPYSWSGDGRFYCLERVRSRHQSTRCCRWTRMHMRLASHSLSVKRESESTNTSLPDLKGYLAGLRIPPTNPAGTKFMCGLSIPTRRRVRRLGAANGRCQRREA